MSFFLGVFQITLMKLHAEMDKSTFSQNVHVAFMFSMCSLFPVFQPALQLPSINLL